MNVGWVGTGVMGYSMCSHIMEAGYPVWVYTRTKDKASGLIARGARWCDSPGELAGVCDIVFTIVGYPQDVEEVYFSQTGLIGNARPGTILVDMTTSSPSLARRISRVSAERAIHALDAPVSGGDVGAREGTLAIMVGGEKGVFDRMLPLLGSLGQNISYMGEAGSGQNTKMSNQILIASTMIGVVESLLYAYRAGLDPAGVIDIIGKGAASSWSINNLGRRIVNGDFNPGFFIKHFIKDMGIALDEALRMKLALPGLSLAMQFYTAAAALGHESLGTQGLYKVFETMNGVDAHPAGTGTNP